MTYGLIPIEKLLFALHDEKRGEMDISVKSSWLSEAVVFFRQEKHEFRLSLTPKSIVLDYNTRTGLPLIPERPTPDAFLQLRQYEIGKEPYGDIKRTLKSFFPKLSQEHINEIINLAETVDNCVLRALRDPAINFILDMEEA